MATPRPWHLLGHWCLESPAMLTPAPVSCGSRKLSPPSHPSCRTERLPPSVNLPTTCDLTRNGPAQKGLWLPNQFALRQSRAFFWSQRTWNLPLIPERLRALVLAAELNLDSVVDSALTTTDQQPFPAARTAPAPSSSPALSSLLCW